MLGIRVALRELAPEAVATVVVEAVLDQIDELALALLPGVRWTALRGLERERSVPEERLARVLETRLGRAVCDLARYAQTGQGLAAWEVPGATLAVERALLGRAADHVQGATGATAEAGAGCRELPEALQTVVLAADARIGLKQRRAIRADAFAALAGLCVAEVERQVGAWVEPAHAAEWLARLASRGRDDDAGGEDDAGGDDER